MLKNKSSIDNFRFLSMILRLSFSNQFFCKNRIIGSVVLTLRVLEKRT